ncbi:hypothetical protein JCM16303_000612 [Sporobolomyces ruberrimus]
MAKSTSKASSKASRKAAPAPRAPSPAASASSRSNAGGSDSSSTDSDSDSSDSDSSSVSPDPEPVPQARRVDPSTQKYSPPEGFKAFKDAGAKSDIDWDTLHADSELQLWAVRVPAGLKSKHLDKMVIQLPPSSIQTPLQPVATFTASKSEYNAYLSTPSPSSTGGKGKHSEEDGEATEVNELDNMLPLLPKKSAGNKLFQAPRPISKTLSIRRALPSALANLPSAASFSHSTLIASQPSPVPGAILSAPELLDPVAIAQKKTTRAQPSGLKFRLDLGGMKATGGKGQFNNGVVLGPREVVRRVDEEGVAFGEGGGEDEAMNDGEGGVVEDEEEKAKRKEEKRAKKEKKRKEKEEGGDGVEKSPKKKKVKVEA